jgi:hypothetical protein
VQLHLAFAGWQRFFMQLSRYCIVLDSGLHTFARMECCLEQI